MDDFRTEEEKPVEPRVAAKKSDDNGYVVPRQQKAIPVVDTVAVGFYWLVLLM